MIPYGLHHIDDDDIQAVVDVLRSGSLTQGPAIECFEKSVAEYVGAKFAVAVSSGTAALHLAALVAGIAPGKTLITSAITFVASANAGLYTGGKVAFADIDPMTINMSPESLKPVLDATPDTRAIIPVHFAGLPCAEMARIKSMADGVGALIIEDAAHALGAVYQSGNRVGCCEHSSMTVFSMHPVKSIAAGEGGIITTNDVTIYRRLNRLRSHGINKSGDHLIADDHAFTGDLPNPWYFEMQELGYHYRITDIQCALANSQLKKLPKFLARRRLLAKNYDEQLAGIRYLKPAQASGHDLSSHHLYPVRIDFAAAGISRAAFMAEIFKRGIISQVHYIPVVLHPFYRDMGFDLSDYPESQGYYNEALSIPLFYDLTFDQQSKVIAALKGILGV